MTGIEGVGAAGHAPPDVFGLAVLGAAVAVLVAGMLVLYSRVQTLTRQIAVARRPEPYTRRPSVSEKTVPPGQAFAAGQAVGEAAAGARDLDNIRAMVRSMIAQAEEANRAFREPEPAVT